MSQRGENSILLQRQQNAVGEIEKKSMNPIVIILSVLGLIVSAATVGYLVGANEYSQQLAWARARISELEHRERKSRE